MLVEVHTGTETAHGNLVLVQGIEERGLEDGVHAWEFARSPEEGHDLEPCDTCHQSVEAGLMIHISCERVFREIPMDFDLLIKGKIVLPRPHVHLR